MNAVEKQLTPIIKEWCEKHNWEKNEISSFIKNTKDIFHLDYINPEGIFTTVELEKDQEAKFPLDFYNTYGRDNFVALYIPKEDKVPVKYKNYDDIYLPTYKVANSIDILEQYIEEKRKDVIRKTLLLFIKGFRKQISNDKLNCLVAAANHSCKKPLNNIKELVDHFANKKQKLTHLIISRKAMEILQKESAAVPSSYFPKLSDTQDNTIPRLTGINELHGMRTIVIDGAAEYYYKHFCNEKLRWYQKLWHKFFPKQEKDIMIGLDLSKKDALVQVLREDIYIFNDPTLEESLRCGVYGWCEYGIGVMNSNIVGFAHFPWEK